MIELEFGGNCRGCELADLELLPIRYCSEAKALTLTEWKIVCHHQAACDAAWKAGHLEGRKEAAAIMGGLHR